MTELLRYIQFEKGFKQRSKERAERRTKLSQGSPERYDQAQETLNRAFRLFRSEIDRSSSAEQFVASPLDTLRIVLDDVAEKVDSRVTNINVAAAKLDQAIAEKVEATLAEILYQLEKRKVSGELRGAERRIAKAEERVRTAQEKADAEQRRALKRYESKKAKLTKRVQSRSFNPILDGDDTKRQNQRLNESVDITRFNQDANKRRAEREAAELSLKELKESAKARIAGARNRLPGLRRFLKRFISGNVPEAAA